MREFSGRDESLRYPPAPPWQSRECINPSLHESQTSFAAFKPAWRIPPERERSLLRPPASTHYPARPCVSLVWWKVTGSDVYTNAIVYTLFTRNRMTFSVPVLCFSLHLLHSVSNASGRCSERIAIGIQIRDVFTDLRRGTTTSSSTESIIITCRFKLLLK